MEMFPIIPGRVLPHSRERAQAVPWWTMINAKAAFTLNDLNNLLGRQGKI